MSFCDVRQRDVTLREHHGLPHLPATIVHLNHHNEHHAHSDHTDNYNTALDDTDHIAQRRNIGRNVTHESQPRANERRTFYAHNYNNDCNHPVFFCKHLQSFDEDDVGYH